MMAYRNIDTVLSVLNNNKANNLEAVSQLLDIYNNVLKKSQEETREKSFPLIILEGLDGCGKSTTGKKLADRIGAVQWGTPPSSIKLLRTFFDDHAVLRTAYYALGNYIAALEVSLVLRDKPVIMDRFWHSTCAYAIAQYVYDNKSELPPNGNEIYKWPEDLLKPDKVYFLDVTESVRLQRLSRRTSFTTQETLLQNSSQFRQDVLTAYRNMTDPGVTFIDGDSSFGPVLRKLESELKDLKIIKNI